MGSYIRRVLTVAFLLHTISPVLSIETVSIISLYPSNQHSCVTRCIYTYYLSDIGNALHCGSPYANDCFCNTAAASASAATSWLAACGSSNCAAGDITDDLTSMHSIYASYCINAGFTQPGATDWYNPTSATAQPGQTPTSGSASTTTQLTVVTQTAPSTSSSAAATQLQVSAVTIHTTSTLLVGPDGTPISAHSKSGPNKTALGVGLGLGITLAVIIVALGLWLWFRRKRSSQTTAEYQNQEAPPMVATGTSSPIKRKAVQAKNPSLQTKELTGDGVRRELSGREVSPVPREPEMGSEGLVMELPEQVRSPPPEYSHEGTSQITAGGGADGQGPRWELG